MSNPSWSLRRGIAPFIGALRLSIVLVLASLLLGVPQSSIAGGWYVANTASTEWLLYKHVWLSAGSYRFTARAASPANGSLMRVEIDNVVVQWSVPVPNTGRADSFTYVNLGNRAISQGYHDIKVVFESSNVSLDWFMLSKDTDTSTSVKASDITMVRPSTSGMLIAPVFGFEHKTVKPGVASSLCSVPENDINGNSYTDAQLRSWYAVPMYRDYDRRSDRYWDIAVDELLASRAQVPLLHCRPTSDFTRGLQDRDYVEGPGAYEGRWLQKFSEAVARNPQAASALKIGMFWESGGIASSFKDRYGYYPAWGDPALVDYVMQYWLNPWFDNVPSGLLYQPLPSRPIISFYASRPDNIVSDGRMGDFLMAVRSRLQERYGYNPLFILPVGGDVDGQALAQGWGQAPWLTWDGPLLETNNFAGMKWGTLSDGSRRRLDTVWLNDWNPATNSGSPNASDANGHDSHQSRLDASGNSALWNSLNQARSAGFKLVQEEGFTNISEGNGIFRSYHPEWNYPNQHLATMREFADPDTQTLLFEAEDCDTYFKTVTNGNDGGSYRYEWYPSGNAGGDLDVYRPLHNLQGWISKNSGPANLTQISAGFFDVWAVATDGKLWAQPIMGEPNAWHQVDAPTLTSVSVGKGYVWALNGTTVYSTAIPYQWNYWATTGWTQRTGTMTQLSVGDTEVWAVNASGQIFRRPLDGSGDWTQVTGTMNKIALGDAFVWGIQGTSIYYSRTSSVSWTQVANPNNISKIAVGSEEVWGVNASGQVFRRSVSGVGDWDAVTSPGSTLTSLTIGDGYMWGLAGASPYTRRLEGFLGSSALSPMGLKAVPGNAQVSLSWVAVTGATGYNLKRATNSGGPYTTVASNLQPGPVTLSYSDTATTNGTAYYYVVSALTSAGETANSEEASATPQSQLPSSPTGLAVAAGFGNQITLSWSDNSTTESGFKIERKIGATGTYVPMAIVGKNVATFSDSVIAGPDYYYRVCAYNPAGNSAYSNEAVFSTSSTLLSRAGWLASASVSAGGNPPLNVLDGDSNTRWGTGTGQAPGQWFQVDMGVSKNIFQISLEISGGDYPRGYEVYLSADGTNWGSPVASGSGATTATVISFPTQAARYIRINQTGTDGVWWSIAEFKVYGADAPVQVLSRSGWTASASSSGGGDPASNALDGNNGTRWSTGAGQANGQWFQVDMGSVKTFQQVVLDASASSGDYPRGYQVQVSNDGVNWSSPVATGAGSSAITTINFAPQTARYIRVTQTGTNSGWWSIHEFNVYGAVVSAPAAPSGLGATGGNGQAVLNWSAVTGATSYNVKRATTSGGPYATVNSGGATSFTNTGLNNGTAYFYVVTATNSGGESANSNQASVTPGALPSPWQTADIGSVGVAGNAFYVSPTYTLAGSGSDIWGAVDTFRYVYQASSGDCSIVARVSSEQNTDPWAKAGVMIRETSGAGAINAALVVTPGGISFQWRTATGGQSTNVGGGGSVPYWLKLTRTGNSVAAYSSSNGTTWTQVGTTQTLTMASSATIGLAVTAHNNTVLCTSTFDNVTATP